MAQRSGAQSAFFVGYFLMNLSSAVLVSYWGSKKLLLVNVAVSSLLTVATPGLVVAYGYYLLLNIRIVLGLIQVIYYFILQEVPNINCQIYITW